MKWCVILFLAACASVLYGQSNDDDDDFDFDNVKCLPKLADDCFKYVHDSFRCEVDSLMLPSISKCDEKLLCSNIKGAIECADDIIDNDCSVADGRDRFDLWMNGMTKVYEILCANNMTMLRTLFAKGECWNSRQFLKCLEDESEVVHVIDFLKIKPDLNTCYRLAVSLSTCSGKSMPYDRNCARQNGVVKEIIHSFFTQSSCGIVRSNASKNFQAKYIYILLAFSVATLIKF
ncbi:uncharacterized protein [Anabrus simplex]|uniref:uncharacterized protein n=1 Tax=Anabrus simplex TaxID=316456 RepID=UPI0035A37EDA